MICTKVHHSYRDVVALCDSELIGRKFEEENKQLDLRESFYKDQTITLEEAIQLIKKQSVEDSTFNIVGSNSIKAAQEAGLINQDSASSIQEIPFALVLL